MTLKNNHLIVETEERNDIEADSRETTMKYSPGARDGIFIVEVQQGVRRSPTAVSTATSSNFNVAVKINDQCALVHNSADSSSEDLPIEEPDDLGYIETVYPSQSQKLTNTGLTQSNSSLSHPSYSYTDQQCYDNEGYGYNLYKGYLNDEPLKKLHFNQKLKITSAVYKNPSKSIDLESPADGFLLSDREAAARCVLVEESEVNRIQNDIESNKKLKGSKNDDSIENCASQTGAS
ncbi:hypothetical protein WA026_010792 [Henosepilachna vigintioctopunctata]|uniref:Uncharacterized protein n=1 Tax=Henosepilachna vigintioctopunctata TaxID=420089 RepID=A0AAW1UVZ3_9CUCU